MMTKKHKILWCASALYGLALIITTVVTIVHFTRPNFALLFILITLWPIGRFFLLRHSAVSAWLNRLDH